MNPSACQIQFAVRAGFWMAANDLASVGPIDAPHPNHPSKGGPPWSARKGRLLPMVKLIVMARRRPGLGIDAFHDYWLNTHGPLIVRLAPALRVQRYVQNHAVQSEAAQMFLGDRDAADATFDGVVEGWWKDERDMIEAFSSPEGQEASRLLAEDEQRFCGKDNVALLAYAYEFVSETAGH